jgi:hypothetical protein
MKIDLTLPTYEKLVTFLRDREGDIAVAEEDLGELKPVFKEVIGREAVDCRTNPNNKACQSNNF